MDAGYELWDRFTGNLILDFEDRNDALAFVRSQIEGLDPAHAEREVERMALVRVASDQTNETVAKGRGLLELILTPSYRNAPS